MIAIHVITFLLNLEVAKKISRMEGIIQMQIYGHEQIPQCLLDSATIDCGIFLCPLNLATKKHRRLCMFCTASKTAIGIYQAARRIVPRTILVL